MSTDSLRELMHAQPFVPFVLHNADGRSYEVPHSDFISISRTGRMARVSTEEYHGEGAAVLDVVLLVGATMRDSDIAPPPSDQGGNDAER